MVNQHDENGMKKTSTDLGDPNQPAPGSGATAYEIRVKGYLDSSWSNWLGGMEMRSLDCGETVLYGPVVDQAALMGILNKLVRLNLALISVNEILKKDQDK